MQEFNKINESRILFETVIKIDPKNAYANVNLAQNYFKYCKNYNKSKILFENIIKIRTNYSHVYNNLAWILKEHFNDYNISFFSDLSVGISSLFSYDINHEKYGGIF